MPSRRTKLPTSLPGAEPAPVSSGRLQRVPNLVTQVEQFLREAIRTKRFGDKLPTEIQLADELGVSRETVRRAAEVLTAEGLLVKYRRKGTFLASSSTTSGAPQIASNLIGFLQADYRLPGGEVEATVRHVGNLMLEGALEAAARDDCELVVRRAAVADLLPAVRRFGQDLRLRGVVFASVGEEKLLRRVAGLGLPIVLMDHDAHLPGISTIRDDSAGGAKLAVSHLVELGHRQIAIASWHATDLNPWRLEGYRDALRAANLPRRRKWELLSDLSAEGARQVAQALVAITPRPTAMYCFNNLLAEWVIRELRQLGVQVPEEISVVGGGGIDVAGLTYHQADWRRMGQRAIEVLLSSESNGNAAAPQYHLQSHVMVEGNTTQPISA